jgi:hypothetical protein
VEEYWVVLFRNKERVRTYKRVRSYKSAIKAFNELIDTSKDVIFEKQYANLSSSQRIEAVKYKLCIISNKEDRRYRTSIEIDGDYYVIKEADFKIEEGFLTHLQSGRSYMDFKSIKEKMEEYYLGSVYYLNSRILVTQMGKLRMVVSLKNKSDRNRMYFILKRELYSKLLFLGKIKRASLKETVYPYLKDFNLTKKTINNSNKINKDQF